MKYEGNPVSKGIAFGSVFVYESFSITVTESHFPADQLEQQKARYQETIAKSAAEMEKIAADLRATDPDKAAIFGAHLEILHDVVMNEEIDDAIDKEYCSPDWAITRVYDTHIAMLESVADPLIQERAADLRDVRGRLIRNWNNVEEKNLAALPGPAIVAACDLLPSDTATIDRKNVLAIVTEIGGSTSHSALIARSYEIPALLGVKDLMKNIRHGQEAVVDAVNGTLILDPDQTEKNEYGKKRTEFLARAEAVKKFICADPVTADGTRVDIGLNIGSASNSALEGARYTDFIGLFRTEFLYMESKNLPTEEQQFAEYKKALEVYNPRPVTIRTLDIGGDKTLESMDLPKEDNPFLGNRALRLCFDRPDVFRTQLRALLRASVYGNLWLMLPMVGSLDDIRKAKAFIEEVKAELAAEAIPFSKDMKIGIMVEIPSIAIIADQAAKEVDFASVGSNDLCQYMTAVDRLNPVVAKYYQSYHPAMFRLIGSVVDAFVKAGKPVSICGELGGDELAAAVLVGMGMRKLSMGINSVADIKCMLVRLTIAKAKEMAETVTNMATAGEVEAYLNATLKSLQKV